MRQLFAEIGQDIPLHTASRFWLGRIRDPANRELGSIDDMRWGSFITEARNLSVQFDPAPCQGKRPSRDSMAIPTPRPCAWCGKPFIGRVRNLCCSKLCGGRWASRNKPGGKQPQTLTRPGRDEEVSSLLS